MQLLYTQYRKTLFLLLVPQVPEQNLNYKAV